MKAKWASDRGSLFYRYAACAAILIAFIGFFLTYIQPVALNRFNGPSWSHLHGALLATWLLLVMIQAFLLPHQLQLHRILGWSAVLLAPAIALSTIAIGYEITAQAIVRDGAEGFGNFTGNVTAPSIFLLLVSAAIILRRKPQWHKRLIFLATVAMLWPAWFRWRHIFPWIPRPDIVLGLIVADLPILIAMVRDKLRFGAVHPAYVYAGVGLIVEQTVEVLLFGSEVWQALGQWLFERLPAFLI
jgi:hypothetical protein